MKRLLWLVLLVACVPARTASHAYYVSHPAHTQQTARTAPVMVFIDERTLLWMNAVMLNTRHLDVEYGGCAHIAKRVGDGFYVDSILPPRPNPLDGVVSFSPWEGHFSCNRDEAPIHWHPNIVSDMCELSVPNDRGGDTHPAFSVFPFNLMQCGIGIDSVLAYRVRPAAEVAHGKGK